MTAQEFKLLTDLRTLLRTHECSVEYGYDPESNDDLVYTIVGPNIILELNPELFEELRIQS